MNPLWSVIGALAGAVLGGLIVHFGARSRDRENDRRRQRVDYLVNAYRTLARSAHRELRGERGEAFEDALSDVVLLGTGEQIAAARRIVTDLAASRSVSIDPLLVSLRIALRNELGIKADQLEQVPSLRMSWSDQESDSPVTTRDNVRVRFDEALTTTRESLALVFAGSGSMTVGPTTPDSEFRRLYDVAKQAPGSAVAGAYGKVSDRLVDLLTSVGVEHFESRDALDLAKSALEHGIVTEQSVHTVEGLSILMNLSRAGGSGTGLSPEKAAEFLNLAAATIYSLGGTSG